MLEAKRQALTLVLSKRFELERSSLDENVVKALGRAEREIMQIGQAINQIKAAVKANTNVSLLSHLNQTFHKSLNGTKEIIGNVEAALMEQGPIEHSLVVFKQELAEKVIRTISTENA